MTQTESAPADSSWAELYQDARRVLPSAQEARWLIEEVAGEPWPPVAPPTGPAVRRLLDLCRRRQQGVPLQYLLGHWPFRTLDLVVDHRVLIPRPETEQVVEVALAELDAMGPRMKTVVDLGTGSGAIALSIALERPRTRVWATDLSAPALDVAQVNLSRLDGDASTRVMLRSGDWWSALPPDLMATVDLVVSNPPYIPSGQLADLDPAVKDWEPRLALDAGPTGLAAVKEILVGASAWLCPTGVVVLEIGDDQAGEAAAYARFYGLGDTAVHQDLAGRDRTLVARAEAGSSI